MTHCPDVITQAMRKRDQRITLWVTITFFVLTPISLYLVKMIPL